MKRRSIFSCFSSCLYLKTYRMISWPYYLIISLFFKKVYKLHLRQKALFSIKNDILRVSIYFLAKTCPPSFNEIFRTADSRLILFLPACLSTQGVYKKVNDSWPPCTCTALSAAELWIFETIYLKFNKPDFALIFTIRFEF